MAANPTPSIGPFPLGMDNRAPDFKLELPDNAGHLLRDAVNVDATEHGSVKTRDGFKLAEAGVDCHSAWALRNGTYGLYCDSGDIFRVDLRDDGTLVRSQVASGYGRIYPVVYAQVNESVYFTDGLRVGSYHPVSGPTPAWLTAQPQMVGDVQFSRMPAGSAIPTIHS